MKVRLRTYWEQVRTTLWFLPGILILGAFFLALGTVAIDNAVRIDNQRGLGLLWSGGPSGAQAMLSAIATAIITVVTFTFSTMIVALTLASAQFGPRLLRNFMRDRASQLAMGVMVGTFVYSVVVLRTVRDVDEAAFTPSLSVSVAVVLALLSMATLIYFINHIAHSIQAPQLVAGIGHELLQRIDDLYPGELGEAPGEHAPLSSDEHVRLLAQSYPLAFGSSGYLQGVDGDTLLGWADRHDLVVMVKVRPGDFVIAGSPLAMVHAAQEPGEAVMAGLRQAFVVGNVRTPVQDIEFLVRQLEEVAVRALSPSTNDPYTAIQCLDWLGAGLVKLAQRPEPSPYRFSGERLRMISERPSTFPGIADASFNQIRQYGRTSPAVMMRMLELMRDIADFITTEEQRDSIADHARMVAAEARDTLSQRHDQEDLEQRYRRVRDALQQRWELLEARHLFPDGPASSLPVVQQSAETGGNA